MSGERLNFAVGPVMMHESIRSIGKEQIPYFRTQEFSKVMKENEELLFWYGRDGNGSNELF